MKIPSRKVSSYMSISLLEFQHKFLDEKECYEFLFRKFRPDGFCCPFCQGPKAWFLPSRKAYECSSCGRQISLTAGTIFHKSKVPLNLWFWMIFLISTNKKGCSALNAQRLLGIKNYRTVWLMAHKIRYAMIQRDQQYKLAGTVEVDESY